MDDFPARMQALETLLHEVENYRDPAARTHTRGIVQAVLELHAVGLERLLEHVADAGPAGQDIIDECSRDEVIEGLLLLHGLHPLGLEERVGAALHLARPHLDAHGAGVELLEVYEGMVRLRLETGKGCASTAASLRRLVEDAIYAKAPDVTRLVIEGSEETVADEGRFALPLVG